MKKKTVKICEVSLHFTLHELLIVNKLFLKRKRRNTFSLDFKEMVFKGILLTFNKIKFIGNIILYIHIIVS